METLLQKTTSEMSKLAEQSLQDKSKILAMARARGMYVEPGLNNTPGLGAVDDPEA